MVKKCTKCYIVKVVSEFRKSKNGKFNVTSICKLCLCEYEKKRRLNGESNHKLSNQKYYKKNKEIIKLNQKKSRESNKEGKKEYDRQYRKKNRIVINQKKVIYYKKNPHLKMWRTTLESSLRRLGVRKTGKTIDILGYSAIELKNHLEGLFTDGMTWSNYGEWHVDHVVGVITFPPVTLPSVVNALSNLQPLWATTREINGVVYEGNLNKGWY